MKILVLQHIPIEDPGYIKVLMQQDQCELTTIELDAGEKIPNNLAEKFKNAMLRVWEDLFWIIFNMDGS